MSPHQLVALAVRLFAIWLGLYWARAMPAYFVQTQEFDDPTATGIAIAFGIVALAIVIVLWVFPRTAALTLLPPTSDTSAEVASPDTWFAVGCGLWGLWLLAEMFPDLVRYLYLWYYSQRTHIDLGDNFASGGIYYVAKAVVGVWLLLWALEVRERYFGGREVLARDSLLTCRSTRTRLRRAGSLSR